MFFLKYLIAATLFADSKSPVCTHPENESCNNRIDYQIDLLVICAMLLSLFPDLPSMASFTFLKAIEYKLNINTF